MLRRVWWIISTLALANVLAIVGLIGWLAASGRINGERVEELREVFMQTVAAEDAAEEQAQIEAERAALEAAEAAKSGKPPITAEQRMEIIRDYSDLIALRTERVRRETGDLIDTLMTQQARLATEREAFDREKADFEQMRAEIADLEGSEQFEKTLKIYTTVKADEASNMMRALLAAGELDQVIAYLSAMPSRTASKIISNFEDEDPALAAGLLENLREYGLAAVPEGR
jgi:flagellar motility protein MotE (MotC chaperone)